MAKKSFNFGGFAATAVGIGIIIWLAQAQILAKVFYPVRTNEIQAGTQFNEVSLADVLQFQKATDCVIIDVRARQFYDSGRIGHAINIPEGGELTGEVREMLLRTANVVIYDVAFPSEHAKDLYGKVLKLKGGGVNFYPKGWREWYACGLPVSR